MSRLKIILKEKTMFLTKHGRSGVFYIAITIKDIISQKVKDYVMLEFLNTLTKDKSKREVYQLVNVTVGKKKVLTRLKRYKEDKNVNKRK